MTYAENENTCNIWKCVQKESTQTSPLKILEFTDKKCINMQMKQLAGKFYFAA